MPNVRCANWLSRSSWDSSTNFCGFVWLNGAPADAIVSWIVVIETLPAKFFAFLRRQIAPHEEYV